MNEDVSQDESTALASEATTGEMVYVVFSHYLLGSDVEGVYRSEIPALRAAHAPGLPQGVLRRTVKTFPVQP